MVFSPKFAKFAAVSGVAIVVSLITFSVCFNTFKWSAVVSQTTAVIVTTPISFYLNRAWVWGKDGKSDLRKEVIPFWVTSALGFVFALGAAWLGERVAKHYFDRRSAQSVVIILFSMGSYGLGWVAKFAYFEKVLFRHEAPAVA